MAYDQILAAEVKALDAKLFQYKHGELVENFIDRSNVGVPNTFVPSATGFAVGGSQILFLAHPQGPYGISPPRWGWVGGVREGLFEWYTDHGMYLLRKYRCTLADYKQLWTIERRREFFGEPKVHNVLALDTTPIFFTLPKIAKAVAQLCHPNPREEAKPLTWIPITTGIGGNNLNASEGKPE